ncbi:MAG: thymidylate synthase [Pseudonocardiaceae bacterium]
MITLTGGSANELYVAACHAVSRDGVSVSPRGMVTTEVLGAHLCLTDPRRRLVDLPPDRVINPAFAVAETLWILSGSDDPWIFQYNRALARYTDDGRLQGAYGPRMRRWRGRVDQLDQVRRILTRDPDSRQAVIQLFDPEQDTRGHRDVPCTLNYRFFLRGDQLHMHTTMRSQDLWLGFPYDVFAATILQELLAGWLGVELGTYHHFVDSLHLYDKHTDSAANLPAEPQPSLLMSPISVEWDGLAGLLSDVIAGCAPLHADVAWRTFAAIMSSYRTCTAGDREQARASAAAIPGGLGRALERWYEHLADLAPAATAIGATQ